VVGQNGKGKTTLLKVLEGRLTQMEGDISLNPTITKAYYEQGDAVNLDEDRTVLDEIIYADADVEQQKARDICGMMMFEGDSALKKIKVLSGGEKSRVMLGRIIVTPVNLLILDEPTNHLDMESCDALLEAINEFEGAVIMVTHNEMLLHGLAERLVVFQHGVASLFEGGYQRFLETRGWDEEREQEDDPSETRKKEKKEDRKKRKRERSELIRERGRALRPVEKEIKAHEKEIVKLEKELETLHGEIEAASREGSNERIAEISRKITACRESIDENFAGLEKASEEFERLSLSFDQRLKDLE
jgi:ATP-binding cassette subfamily F protein 3